MTNQQGHTDNRPSNIDVWLHQYQFELRFSERGKVVSVGDGIVWIHGLPSAAIDEILYTEDGSKVMVFHLTEKLVGAILLEQSEELTAGNRVYHSDLVLSAPVGDELLGRVIDPLGKILDDQGAITDYISFNPIFFSTFQSDMESAYIIIGSERGFCGNFNEIIIEKFKKDNESLTKDSRLIVVGRKLASKMSEAKYQFDSVDGPNSIEEIQSVILNLVKTIDRVNQETAGRIHPGSWKIIYNEANSTIHQSILIPFGELQKKVDVHFTTPPLLNLSNHDFIREILDQYLFAMLHKVFYKSFVAENRQRLLHMEGALSWLDKQGEQLRVNYNRFRQEEITEEIEVILLSAKAILDEMNLHNFLEEGGNG